ncbi:MAG: Xaa-Pro peptidase family protein [Desulforhopalus sp.]|nr:Xaa-Pro peptidase family protein [Desulforhopalus sp.]
MNYLKRIAAVQARLRRKKLDCLLVSCPENRRYLCGYRGGDHGIAETAGLLLVPARGEIRLLTDFRYKIQAERDVPWAEVILYPKGVMHLLEELLPKMGVSSLAFEGNYTLFATAEKMTTALDKRGIRTVSLVGLIEDLRTIKDDEEIEQIRQAVRLNEGVFAEIYESLYNYATEIEIALAIEATMRRRGAEGPSFASIVASGANGALPHAVPSPSYLQPDASLTIDMGLVLGGYCSDMTRNFVPRTADDRYRELHRLVRKAQLAGMAAVRDGARACDVDQAARRIISDAGYGEYFGHSLGHGVGLAVHEEPRVSTNNTKKLRAGMVVTIEPGIYIPGWGGIRLENMVVVREGGCENLNSDTTWLDI